MLRTHTLGEVNEKLVGKKVVLSGWVDNIRMFKDKAFILLRDRYGRVQAIVSGKAAMDAKDLTLESCIQLEGKIKARPEGQINKDMASGKVELDADKIIIFSKAPQMPFDIKAENIEEVRLKNRFLDLRTDRMQRNMKIRSDTILSVLEFFNKEEFMNIETPIMAKSTPEGARDYLVPARKFPGNFYALPQSPQLFKQLTQVAGFDKYIQIARCFRDEDSRKDRQPEFTQIDVEMSFIEQEDIIDLTEKMLKYVFKKVLNEDIKIPFKRLTYEEAMENYGTDRPDLRKNKNDPNEFAFCWVVDFPLFEYGKEEKRYKSSHHPFTMPVSGKKGKLDFNEKSNSYAYDVVLNGSEIGGGSIRIHDPGTQQKIFDLLKISKKDAENKFGFLLNALKYGAPPHGGIALGLDRLVQLISKEETIRDVIAFPKNKEGKDTMLDAPSEVSKSQLNELGLELKKVKKKKMKFLVASGPVIIEEGKLLVNMDNKDNFYKLPGGTVEKGDSLEDACHREAKEENNAEIEIIRPLNPMIIYKNPQTEEEMTIVLIHYEARLKNKEDMKPMEPIKEVKWLSIEEIKQGKYDVAPNIKFLIEKGDIK